MSHINTGGRAFPLEVRAKHSAQAGMTLRDYFIAHAPTEPAMWFEPVMATERPKVEAVEPIKRWWHCIFPPDNAGRILLPRYSAEHYEWNAEYRKQCRIQWPAAWADQMLIQRNKESNQ